MSPRPAPPSALYVHVPLCRSKCAYCDFFSLPAASASEAFLERLVDATIARAAELGERFGAAGYATLYVGGGTPTVLPPKLFSRLLSGLGPFARGAAEWSVEANPESLKPAAIDAMRDAGVTRVSLGVQSLDEDLLRVLGRAHDAAAAERAVALARDSGLRVSADLIARVPRPAGAPARPRDLAREAARLVELGVGHLSVYDLVVEEGTRIEASLRAGELRARDEDEAADESDAALEALAGLGFRRYEVSNYAPAGAECLHNLAYWRMDSYVGAGPGAVSTIASPGGGSLRITESRDLGSYPERAAGAATEEPISPREAAFESCMMGFRTRFGLDLEAFAERHGREFEELAGTCLAAWRDRLAPAWGPGRRLALDDRGLDLLNRFLAQCLAEMESTFPAPAASDPLAAEGA